jgi:hypothetical protein
VRGALSAPIDVFSGSPCFAVPKPKIVALGCENRGIELRRPPHLFSYTGTNASVQRGVSVALGRAIATASAPSLFGAVCLIRRGRGRRRAPAATARWQVERVVICGHLFVRPAMIVDCPCATGTAMLLTRTPVLCVPKAKERADGLPMRGSPRAFGTNRADNSARGCGDGQGSQRTWQHQHRKIRAAAQRDHSKLQKPPSTPDSGSGAAAAATNNVVAGANCSRRAAGVQFEPPEAVRRRARARRFLSACEGS